MAPQTNIGSSTPISVGGEDIQKDLRRKVVNDAAASLRALAKSHGRNANGPTPPCARRRTSPPPRRCSMNVIDVVAPTLPALLDKIDGYKTIAEGLHRSTPPARRSTTSRCRSGSASSTR